MKLFGANEISDFLWMMAGNFIFYIYLAILIKWGETKRILITFQGLTFLDWQFETLISYVAWATFITLPIAYCANFVFNYAYVGQAVANSSQWFSQIMTWGAAPLTFIIFAWIFGINSPGTIKIGLIMGLLFLIKLVMISKI